MKPRLGAESIFGLVSAVAMTVMLSCNQLQKPGPTREIEMAPSIQSEEENEKDKQPLATGGDLVMNPAAATTISRVG